MSIKILSLFAALRVAQRPQGPWRHADALPEAARKMALAAESGGISHVGQWAANREQALGVADAHAF
jgi:hypothetical protein